jgi:hypothetical protein
LLAPAGRPIGDQSSHSLPNRDLIKTKNGESYGIWPDKLSALRAARYDIEFEFNGRVYRKITKAQPANCNDESPKP